MPNRHGTIDPGLGDRQRELRQQQIATVTIATAAGTSQRRSRHREHQRGRLGPLTHRQEVVDKDVRLDPDTTHAVYQLLDRLVHREVLASSSPLRDTTPSTPPELSFEPIRQVHARHREGPTSQECSPRCSPNTSPHPSSATNRARPSARRAM